MTTVYDHVARTDAPVLDSIAERWSTRVFDPRAPLDEDAFESALEAARWAPSADNAQPWRVLVARRDTMAFDAVCDALVGFNREWAPAASALMVLVAETADEHGAPREWSGYDTGQAAAYFTIQAQANGLLTHQMGGFDRETIAETFGLDARFAPVVVVAVGTHGDPEAADIRVRMRELAGRKRRPVGTSILLNV